MKQRMRVFTDMKLCLVPWLSQSQVVTSVLISYLSNSQEMTQEKN